MAVEFLQRKRDKPFALFFAHKAVHPDAYQAADGTIDLSKGGYRRRRATPISTRARISRAGPTCCRRRRW